MSTKKILYLLIYHKLFKITLHTTFFKPDLETLSSAKEGPKWDEIGSIFSHVGQAQV